LVQRNLWHSCGPWTVEGFLEGKGPRARELFDAFVALVREVGPFTFAPAKTRVGFMVRVRFAGVMRLSDRGMTCGFWLKRRVDSPRFTKVEHLERDDWLYTFRVTDPAELDDEVRGWMREAYDVGRQAHRLG
jgi:hypothetical protein